MYTRISDERELGFELHEGRRAIVVEGQLVPVVARLVRLGKPAWTVVASTLGAAMSLFVATGVPALPLAVLAGTPAAMILGSRTAMAALGIGMAAGGMTGLQRIRDYEIERETAGELVLRLRVEQPAGMSGRRLAARPVQ